MESLGQKNVTNSWIVHAEITRQLLDLLLQLAPNRLLWLQEWMIMFILEEQRHYFPLLEINSAEFTVTFS